MIHHPDIVAEAAERAIAYAHLRARVVGALALWETWIVAVSVLYLAGHGAYWWHLGLRVVGR